MPSEASAVHERQMRWARCRIAEVGNAALSGADRPQEWRRIARPTGGSKLLNNTGETAVPLSPTRTSGEVFAWCVANKGEAEQLGLKSQPEISRTYDERDPPREEKNRAQKQRKKRKNRVTRGEGFLSSVANRRSGGFSFFSLWGKLIRFDD